MVITSALPETIPTLLPIRTCEKNLGTFTEVRCLVKDVKWEVKRIPKGEAKRGKRIKAMASASTEME